MVTTKPNVEVNLSRRGMVFKIARLLTRKLVTGNYRLPNVGEISAEELSERMRNGPPPIILDTRTKQEYYSGFGHIPGSVYLPLMEIVGSFGTTEKFKTAVKEIEAKLVALQPSMEQEIITVCPGGGFSLVAAEIMAEAGFADVKSLAGGADGWFKKGYPTTKAEGDGDED